MRRGHVLACASIILVSVAQILLKVAALAMPVFQVEILWRQIFEIAFRPGFAVPLIAAGLLYASSMVIWIKTLSYLPLSIAYPLLSLSYALVYVAASTLSFLDEPLSVMRSVGVLIIIIGVLLISRGPLSHEVNS